MAGSMPSLCGRRHVAGVRPASIRKVVWVSRNNMEWPKSSPAKRAKVHTMHRLCTGLALRTPAFSSYPDDWGDGEWACSGSLLVSTICDDTGGELFESRAALDSPDLSTSLDLMWMWITWGLGKCRFWFSSSGLGSQMHISNEVSGGASAAGPRTSLWVSRSYRTIRENYARHSALGISLLAHDCPFNCGAGPFILVKGFYCFLWLFLMILITLYT